MKPKQELKQIPEKKIKEVETLSNLIKNKKTILVTSIKNIPASQFQEISKKLRGKAIIKVPKKTLIFRAIEHSKNHEIKKLEEHIEDSFAILFSDLDAYELAGEIMKKRSPAKAKPGQEAPEDIEIQEGPTELVPGPAISELGALGIQIQIEKGKIHIKESKIIVKKGHKITQAAAELMSKLDIAPFTIGFVPLCAFDTKDNKLYLNIQIDTEGTIKDLKESFAKAITFAVNLGYASSDTIKFLIGKAAMQEKALDALMAGENQTQSDITEGGN
jgi:large subunit ribosomal protein L10